MKRTREKKFWKEAGILLIAAAMFLSAASVTANTNDQTKAQLTTQSNYVIENTYRDIIWDNGGTTPSSNLYSSQLDQVYPFVSQVADDFHFEVDMLITDVHWYGGFWGGTAFDPCDFWIYIYADDGTGNAPTGAGMPDPSPTALWSGFYPGVTGLPLDPNGFYSYEVDIVPPFLAEGCHKYWIAIQAVFPFPPQWGWANTAGIKLHSAVQGFPILGTPFWTTISPEVDMAFYLTGEEVQPPKPDLSCDGSLNWDQVAPGATVTGEFYVGNVGEVGSMLNWEIESYPPWGTWTFTPESGTLADGVWQTVNVTVVAPPDKNTEFTGKVKVVNTDDPSDYCYINVYLKTPVIQNSMNSQVYQYLKLVHLLPMQR